MSTLCLTCKLCCTSAFFTHVVLSPDDVSRLAKHRLPVVERENASMMLFPCPAHDGCCSIYPDRPTACRDYECSVLAAVKAGEMPETDARTLLDRANAALAALRTRVPGTGHLWTDLDRYCEDSQEWRTQHAELLFEVFAVRGLLRRVDPKHVR